MVDLQRGVEELEYDGRQQELIARLTRERDEARAEAAYWKAEGVRLTRVLAETRGECDALRERLMRLREQSGWTVRLTREGEGDHGAGTLAEQRERGGPQRVGPGG